jgi:GTPase SAR1 family protein
MKWVPEVQDKKKVKDAHGSPVIVVGNKIDLRKTQTGCVTTEEGKKLVEALKADPKVVSTSITYMECSALTSDGIKDIFDGAIKIRLIERYKAGKKKCSIL